MILRNIYGCNITVAALEGRPYAELSETFDSIAKNLMTKLQADLERAERQLNEASERYVFV